MLLVCRRALLSAARLGRAELCIFGPASLLMPLPFAAVTDLPACRCPQTVIIDGRAHMMGRLASIVAKQVLAGHHLVSGAAPACPALTGASVQPALGGLSLLP